MGDSLDSFVMYLLGLLTMVLVAGVAVGVWRDAISDRPAHGCQCVQGEKP